MNVILNLVQSFCVAFIFTTWIAPGTSFFGSMFFAYVAAHAFDVWLAWVHRLVREPEGR